MFLKLFAILVFVNVYFVYHLLMGNFSIFNYFAFKKEIKEKEMELQLVVSERKFLETILMKKDISLDFAEEYIRQKTGFLRPDEIIVVDNEA